MSTYQFWGISIETSSDPPGRALRSHSGLNRLKRLAGVVTRAAGSRAPEPVPAPFSLTGRAVQGTAGFSVPTRDSVKSGFYTITEGSAQPSEALRRKAGFWVAGWVSVEAARAVEHEGGLCRAILESGKYI